MIINCPFCQKLLNINGAVGTFVCPYCQRQSQINGAQATPVNYPMNAPSPGMQTSSVYSQQSPAMGYAQSPYPGAAPSPYGASSIPNYSMYASTASTPAPTDPVAFAFQRASTGAYLFRTDDETRNAVNVNGLRVALQQLGFQLSVEICNQLFLKHDADRSGTIQLEEFRCIYQEVNQWVSVFNSLDTDHSGKMEYGEFVDAMRLLNYNITDTLLPVVFNNIDNMHNGYIDLNGFIKMVSIIQVLQMKMNAYDPQHTGKVSLDFNGLLDIVMALPL